MKKLINHVSDVVPEMLQGLATLNPGVSVLQGTTIVVRSDAAAVAAAGKVAIISGGGAGHEPAHGGYVGAGMLSAAVAGEVFTSPSTDAVLEAIRAVAGPAGALLIVKNYTGDRLNFGLAAELARSEGVPVEVVVVAEDVALASNGEHAGRRGLAGAVLVHKIAGAVAAAGGTLHQVANEAQSATADMGTMGVALSSCTVPAAGKPGFELAHDEIEVGLGIHGEPGVERSSIQPADALVEHLLGKIVKDLSLQSGDRVALLINNLGGTPPSELGVVANSAINHLRKQGIVVERAWAGTFLSALEMAGVSLTLLKVDTQRLAWLDAPAQTPAWPNQSGRLAEQIFRKAPTAMSSCIESSAISAESVLFKTIQSVCDTLVKAENILTDMDQKVGDGDLGISLSRGARAILAELASYPAETAPAAVLRRIAATVRRVVGGTSGPLYAVMLLRAAASLEQTGCPTLKEWSAAFTAAVEGICTVGGASPGDRTMVDALSPAAEALAVAIAKGISAEDALDAAVQAAKQGAALTSSMIPRRGRSSYVGQRAVGHADPGAHAVALQLEAIRAAITDSLGDTAK